MIPSCALLFAFMLLAMVVLSHLRAGDEEQESRYGVGPFTIQAIQLSLLPLPGVPLWAGLSSLY